MKILVTGGSGFLGSHIADELTVRGHDVSIFDNCVSKYIHDNQNMIIGSIVDKNDVLNAIKDKDAVYHFAGIAGIDDCKKNPYNAINVNINGTVNVLEACINNSVPRIMFASSAYVFSKYGYIYKTTKIACENIIRDYSLIYGIKYTNMRFGSLYGRRTDDRNSIYKILKNAIENKSIEYNGTGEEYREYIHALDAAKLAVDLLDDEYINKDIMITGQERFKYKDLLNMVNEMLGNNITIKYKNRDDDYHYILTPYNFNANVGVKIVGNKFIDLGQGLLDCMLEISTKNGIN